MRVIKLGLISLVVFGILITLLSLLFPSHVRISKAIDINASRAAIKNQLADLNNWKKWYPGADTMELVTEPGNIKALRANRVGGLIRVTEVNDSSVMVETGGEGVKKTGGGWNIYNSNRPNTYTVQWYLDIHLKWYPWEKFSGILLEKRYGPSMEKGLDKLKAFLEHEAGDSL